MRNYFLVIVLVMCVIVSGCNNSETMKDTSLSLETTKDGNHYFFRHEVRLIADITTSDIAAFESKTTSSIDRTEQTHINVHEMIKMQNGSIYKMAVEPVVNLDGFLDDARLNLFFYVTREKIYRIWSYIYENGELITFYNDDNKLIHYLDSEERILDNSYLACQQNAISSKEEDNGLMIHNIIEIAGNQITSRMWAEKTNGDTYFYEGFEWESEKGLTAYRSGFGAERDTLNLTNILELKD